MMQSAIVVLLGASMANRLASINDMALWWLSSLWKSKLFLKTLTS